MPRFPFAPAAMTFAVSADALRHGKDIERAGEKSKPRRALARAVEALRSYVPLFLAMAVSASAASAQEFPVTVMHAFGETTITQQPQRVASVGWANHEVPLALGIVPVGLARTSWGDDDGDGLLPWVTEKLDELGGETPVIFDEGDGIDFEAVASTNPDIILAAYSGIS